MASRNNSIAADAEDVSDFLQRIKELGQKRDQEDEERNRKLEEEILQGRKERQARREERARSISPTKSSPANTPPHNPYRRSMVASDSFRSQAKNNDSATSPSRQSTVVDDAAELSTGSSPTKDAPTLNRSTRPGDTFETVTMQNRDSNPTSPVSNMPPRELSWQRRPKSQASDRPRSRPLSHLATENASAARSPSTPNASFAEDTPVSRDQIAKSLGSKDPSYFRQTADRGIGSAAYRKNQVEDDEVADHSVGAQLPGMSRPEAERKMSTDSGELSPTRGSPVRGSRSRTMPSSMINTDSARSPMPMSPAQRLEPPGSDAMSTSDGNEYNSVRERTPAMSPAQGRISPEKSERPHSPTKGMGGFVQSAMMKRSDSVSKRWSVQSPQGINRTNSIASNRSSYHPGTSSEKFGELLKSPPMREPTPLSRDHTPRPSSRPTSRPTSSYGGSNATVIQNGIERVGTPGSVQSSMTASSAANDGFVKPALPVSNSISNLATSSRENLSLRNEESKPKEAELPTSPSRTMDPKRWSPNKASWLESALNKPDSVPKPKAPAAPSQPSWMAEIAKAKQKSVDYGASRNLAPKHEVNIGGLMRSPAMGVTTKPLSLGGLPGFNTTSLRSPEAFSKGVLTPSKTGGGLAGQLDGRASPRPGSSSSRFDRPTSSSSNLSTPGAAVKTPVRSPELGKSPSPVAGKVKPETPPKKDFRSNLKPRQPPPPSADNNEVEFKSVFGQLKRTQTKNYVAPDELKDNILRGKSALNATGGPKKTERVDEFRQSILQKKKDFEKAQVEGKGVTRNASISSMEDTVPEAIAKRKTLSLEKEKSGAPATPPKPSQLENAERSTPETLVNTRAAREDVDKSRAPLPQKDISAPGRLQSGGKLADRFNPALAGLLARGPPSAASETSRGSSPSSQRSTSMGTSGDAEVEKPGPKLEHVTKGRARGPRRKAPSSLKKSDEGEKETETTVLAVTAVAAAAAAAAQPATATHNTDTVNDSVEADKDPLKTTTAVKPEDRAPENASSTSQPTSPRKRTMTINRRSRFLEELANKNDRVPEPTAPRSPIKKLNIEDIFQAPSSPVKETARSPVRKLHHEFLPQSPTKAQEIEKKADVAAEVKVNPNSTSNTSTTIKEKPVAPPKSPVLTKSALGDTAKTTWRPINSLREPVNLKPEINSEPNSPGLNSTSHSASLSIHEKKPDPVEHPVSARPLPVHPTPISITPRPKSPLSPSATERASFRPINSLNSASHSASLSIHENKPDPVERPVSARPLPVHPTPISITPRPKSPLSPSATERASFRPINSLNSASHSASHSVHENKPVTIERPVSARPLPVRPTPISITPRPKSPLSPSATERAPTPMSSASPSKKGFPSIPQSTEASKLLREFFGEPISPSPDYKIDTAAILMDKPSSQTPKFNTISCQLFQLAAGGKKTAVPQSQDTTLFEGNLYVCVHTFKLASSYLKSIEVYFWIGDEVADSIVQDTEVFAAREAKAAGGKLIFIYQGREPSIFFQALGGIVITRRGTSNKYDSLAPSILCGRQYLGSIAFDEVDFSPNSLSSGFPYIINSQSAKLWLWKGKGSSAAELSHAKTLGSELALMGDMEEVEEGNEPEGFLKVFGEGRVRIRGGAGHWKLKPTYSGYSGRLFKIEVANVTEISPFTQKSISPHNIFVMDAFFEIYIIIGAYSGVATPSASATANLGGALSPSYSGSMQFSPLSPTSPASSTYSQGPPSLFSVRSNFWTKKLTSPITTDGGPPGNQYLAFHTALQFAQEYGILAAGMEDRPFVPVSTVVVEGMPRDAKVVVRKWSEAVITTRNPDNTLGSAPTTNTNVGIGNGLQRGRSLRVVPLMAALEATRN